MSGLLRRIKRSRTADAGEPLPQGQAAEAEGAAPATGAPAGPEPSATGDTAVLEPATAQPAPEAKPADAKPPEAPKPVLLADPNVPAGVDPAEAPLRPPAGRRGRLRRRLRYLRRARELMLRDLGGLLYEVHRTGGGDVQAHATVVNAKVQRIVSVDAEAHAIETALAAPRAEAIVFQPGIGGSCPTCGELYGTGARFCSNCGGPLGAVVTPAESPSSGATIESIFGRPAPTQEDPPTGTPAAASDDTQAIAPTPGDDAAAPASEPAAAEPRPMGPAPEREPSPAEPAPESEPSTAEATPATEGSPAAPPAAEDDAPRSPDDPHNRSDDNGRTAPDPASADPFATREFRR